MTKTVADFQSRREEITMTVVMMFQSDRSHDNAHNKDDKVSGGLSQWSKAIVWHHGKMSSLAFLLRIG